MLKQVVLETNPPKTFDIDAVDPDEILIIKSISGLDPADVTLFTGDFARAGGYYQGRRTGKRNVVFNFKINPDYKNDVEVSDIREMIYSMFMEPQVDSDAVVMRFIDDRKPDRTLTGYTEKLPSDMFSRDTTAQVSLICVEPYFKTVDVASGSDPLGLLALPLTYAGSARTGMWMEIVVKATTSKITVMLDDKPFILDRSFYAGDIVHINTVAGQRYIRLNNSSDIMAALNPTSKWLELHKGVNNIKVYGTVENDGKAVLTSYEYQEAWWGI